MADDWWANASRGVVDGRTGVGVSSAPTTVRNGGGGDALLAGLTTASPSAAMTPRFDVGGARYAAPAPHARRALPTAHAPDALSGVQLHDLVERGTGATRPGRKADEAAVRALISGVRSRTTRLDSVVRAVSASSDGTGGGGAQHNARCLGLVHALLGAGAHALPSAAAGVSVGGSAALLCAKDVHRAARRARNAPAVDVLGTVALRDALALGGRDANDAAVAACEAYATMLARRLTFAAQYGEVEANYSLDRWYRRLGIENRAEAARVGSNNARQSRLLANDARNATLAISSAASRTVVLLIRAHAPRSAVALCLAEACHAYVYAEYARAKSKCGAPPPRDVQRTLLDAVGLALEEPDAVMLARYAGIDEPVAHEVLTACDDDARPVRIDSRHRRNIVCRFSTFQGLHQAMDPLGRAQRK